VVQRSLMHQKVSNSQHMLTGGLDRQYAGLSLINLGQFAYL